VNTVFTASGSLNITNFSPLGANVSVNVSPSRLAQRSITHVGASAHASVCRIAGTRGPGGSRCPPRTEGTVPSWNGRVGTTGAVVATFYTLSLPTTPPVPGLNGASMSRGPAT
jgi:hypothetical protein